MAVAWNKTKFLGVRYREHKTRKHGINPDRCFSIRYKVDGKDKEEVAGWASEEMSAEKAFKLLSVIRENIRLGVEPSSLAAIRLANEKKHDEDRREALKAQHENLTFNAFWHETYLPVASATKKVVTMETEKVLYAKWIAPKIGNIPLIQLGTPILENLVAYVNKQGKSAATVRYILAVCSQVWNMALSRGLVDGESPVRRIKKPRQDNKRMRFLTPEEARTLLDALRKRSVDMHDMALLALFCGLRAGEIHALTWADVNFEAETLYIRDTKNKESRHAFMGAEVRGMLLVRREASMNKGQVVFPSKDGTKRRWVSDTFERTVRDIGLNNTGEIKKLTDGSEVPVEITDARQRVVFHSLRHTFASWLVQNGTPLYTVAKLMGHSTLEMTQRYSHLAPDTLKKAALSLGGVLAASHKAE